VGDADADVAANDVGGQFKKRHFDDRPGWHETTVFRRIVRVDLIAQFSRLVSLRQSSHVPIPLSTILILKRQ